MRGDRRGATRRPPLPADRRPQAPLLHRLDAAAAQINPFLMAIAAMLLIVDLSSGAALIMARLPVTHIAPPPNADMPVGVAVALMAVQ